MKLAVCTLVAVLTLTVAAVAQAPIHTQKVQFAKGTSSATLKGTMKGDNTYDYVVRAAASQTMTVTMTTSNKSAYFNVNPPGEDAAIFIGSTSGDRFEGKLTASGDYTIRVYLMRNAARRNESANYTLKIAVSGK
jgi:hypothetical protein